MAKCKVWWDQSIQAYRAQFPYQEKVVAFLKANIPHSDRSWDPSSKIWTFTEQHFDGTIKFLRLLYGDQEVAAVSKQQYDQAQQASRGIAPRKLDSNDSMLAEFMRLIPYDAAREAYRKAARMMHPDLGGDMEKMSKVNSLWTKIEKEVYGQ